MDKNMSLGIRKMEIKTTLRFHGTPVRMITIKKKINKVRMCGKREPLDTAVGIQISVTTVDICIDVSQKTETTI